MFKKLFNKILTGSNKLMNNYTLPTSGTGLLTSTNNTTYTPSVLIAAAPAPANATWTTLATTKAVGGQVQSNPWNISNSGNISGANFIGGAAPSHIIMMSNQSGQMIVRLNLDGSVTWANGIEIDAAAAAFANSLSMGAETRAGISNAIKLRMRDSVFEDLINIAKEKGSLTAEDLTHLLEASKIVEKLKGGS